jgi:hypothetical protein
MPRDFEKKLKLKWGIVETRVRGGLTAVVWGRQTKCKPVVERYHLPAGSNNVCGEHGSALKLAVSTVVYNRLMG